MTAANSTNHYNGVRYSYREVALDIRNTLTYLWYFSLVPREYYNTMKGGSVFYHMSVSPAAAYPVASHNSLCILLRLQTPGTSFHYNKGSNFTISLLIKYRYTYKNRMTYSSSKIRYPTHGGQQEILSTIENPTIRFMMNTTKLWETACNET